MGTSSLHRQSHLVLSVLILAPSSRPDSDGIRVKCLLDSGATSNFISPSLVRRLAVKPGRIIREPLSAIDGRIIASALKEFQLHLSVSTPDLPIVETEPVVLAPIDHYDLILGIPWLTRHNPVVDWSRRTVTTTAPILDPVEIQPQHVVNALAATKFFEETPDLTFNNLLVVDMPSLTLTLPPEPWIPSKV
jgi:hypothetical protein